MQTALNARKVLLEPAVDLQGRVNVTLEELQALRRRALGLQVVLPELEQHRDDTNRYSQRAETLSQ